MARGRRNRRAKNKNQVALGSVKGKNKDVSGQDGNAGNSGDNDVSFMDTEPLDMTFMDTERMNFSSGEEGEETETSLSSSSAGEGNENECENPDRQRNDEQNSERDGGESDESGSGSSSEEDGASGSDSSDSTARQIPSDLESLVSDENDSDDYVLNHPPIDISMAPSHEVKRIYSELIQSARGFGEMTNDSADQKKLRDNIATGDALFRQMEVSLSQTLNSSRSPGRTGATLGCSAPELQLACEHTRVCANLLQQAVQKLGTKPSSFKQNEFLKALRASSVDQDGGYSVLLIVRQLAFTATKASRQIPYIHLVEGSLEKDDFLRVQKPPAPKEPKARAPRRKEEIREEDATQSEIVNDNVGPGGEKGFDAVEVVTKEIRQRIKNQYRETQAPQNLLEITQADTVPDVLSRMMGVSFLLRDGYLSLNRDNDQSLDTMTALMLKPEKPPNNDETGEEGNHRNQHIASFSASLLKEVIAQAKANKK